MQPVLASTAQAGDSLVLQEVLKKNLERVRQRIHEACQPSGPDPASVTLVCVTKGIPVETIRDIVALGVTDIGENRVQEARQKWPALGSRLRAEGNSLEPPASSLQPIRWHLVGHLQRNKAKDAVDLFDVIHSLDTVAVAEELERQAAKKARGSRFKAEGKSLEPRASSLEPLEVFIQVNVSGETTKFGCPPDETLVLARTINQCPHLHLKGLMTLAPFTDNPEQARPYFRRLRELRNDLALALSLEPSALSLSMGMSQDFEVAIEEGADLVRIGTAIFGNR